MTFSVAAVSAYSNSVTYALVSGSLPPGLSLNTTTGGITGTPTTISGVYAFGISATDAYSTTMRDFTMNTSVIAWTNGANCGTFVQNTTVSLPLIATSSYNQPVTYSVTSGALPTGLSINGSYISGVMPSTGTYYFTVTAADGYSVSPLLMNVQSVSTPNTDAYAGNVVYLIHFDNSHNDVMGHTVTPSGSFSAAQVLLPSFSPNGAYNQCVYFDGSNSLVYSDPNGDSSFGSNDFTIEWSFNTASVNTGQTIDILFSLDRNGNYWLVNYLSNGFGFSSSQGNFTWTFTPTVGTWYNMAFVRQSNLLYFFVNGVQISGSQSISGTVNALGPQSLILSGGIVNNYYTGFLDEVRITNGTGRYNANYTVALPFPAPVLYQSPNGIFAANAVTLIATSTFPLSVSSYYSNSVTYSLVSGTIPSGFTMNSTSGISGISANSVGTFNFVMDATDGYCNTQKAISATVYLPVTPIWVTPSGSLGSQAQNTNFATTLNAVANCITLTTSSSTSTAGNVLNFSSTTNVYPNMSIIGPYLPPNTTVFQVSSSQIITSKIIPAIPSGVTYNFTPAPVTYAVTTGALPSGLTLNASTGVISGSLPSVGTTTTTNFTVTASTIPSLNASQAFSITVQATSGTYGSSLSFRRPSGTMGTKGQQSTFAAYAQANSTLDMPITYSLASGALPTGLTLDNATGYISGVLPVVTTDTTSNFAIAAADGTSLVIQSFAITTAQNAVTDPYANLVVLALNFDAVGGTEFAEIVPAGSSVPTNAGTTYPLPITDAKGHQVLAYIAQNGGVPVLENNIVRKGSGSINLANTSAVLVGTFDSTTNYSEFFIGTQDFTMEASFYLTGLNTTTPVGLFSQAANFQLFYYSGNLCLSQWYSAYSGSGVVTIGYTPPLNVWLDIALVRHSGVYTVYVNGASVGSFSGSGSVSSNLNNFVGGINNPFLFGFSLYNQSGTLPGYIDEARVTIGVARYTSNYTVQAQPFS